MDWRENINTIKEIYPGHFQIILDFATEAILKFILSDNYNYVWVYSYDTKDSIEWNSYELPLLNNQEYYKVLARKINFDFIQPTKEFKNILDKFNRGINLVQLNKLPPYYLNPDTIKGKKRYELLLKECDYLFEIQIPSATDYGTLVSADKDFLQSLLDNKNIDWTNLP